MIVIKTKFTKFLSVLMCILILSGSSIHVYSFSTGINEVNPVCDEIINIARSKTGYYGDGSNEFNLWYYGQETTAAWCAVFVSWCADQVGAMGTSVPKRATCESMKLWFERRNEYYSVNSGYIPQKGDIVFINITPENPDRINHVEFVSESGYITEEQDIFVSCIGGNTSDKNYNGSGYVTEKMRPLKNEKAEIIGYAHPSYENSTDCIAKLYNFADDAKTDSIRFIESKMIRIFVFFESWFVELFGNIKFGNIIIF